MFSTEVPLDATLLSSAFVSNFSYMNPALAFVSSEVIGMNTLSPSTVIVEAPTFPSIASAILSPVCALSILIDLTKL